MEYTKIFNTEIGNISSGLRGMRSPMNSCQKLDSCTVSDGSFRVGASDLTLAEKLYKAGSDPRRFLWQINAPIYNKKCPEGAKHLRNHLVLTFHIQDGNIR